MDGKGRKPGWTQRLLGSRASSDDLLSSSPMSPSLSSSSVMNQSTQGAGLNGCLDIVILSADQLQVPSGMAQIDPYCSMKTVDGTGKKSKGYRTVVRKKTTNPHWREKIALDDLTSINALEFSVRSWSRITKHKVLGFCELDLHKLIDGKKHYPTLNLDPVGKLNLVVEFTDDSDLFGLPLEDTCRREHRSVPFIITKCVEDIESRGLDVVGLYRVAGNARIVSELRNACEEDIYLADIGPDTAPNISSVAALLKAYLRELPDPLFTSNFYSAFVALADEQTSCRQRIRSLQGTLNMLPKPNQNTIYYLFEHFARVVRHEPNNKMSAMSLATCVGPSLMTPAGATGIQKMNVQKQNAIIQFLMENWTEVKAQLEPPSPERTASAPRRLPRPPSMPGMPPPVSSPSRRESIQESLPLASSKDFRAFSMATFRGLKKDADPKSAAEFRDFCAVMGVSVDEDASASQAEADPIERFSHLLEQSTLKDTEDIALARQRSRRSSHRMTTTKPYLKLAKSMFQEYASTHDGQVTWPEFRRLVYDLGIYLEDETVFTKLSHGGPVVALSSFLLWWGSAGLHLAEVYSGMQTKRLFIQAIAFFQAHDTKGRGELDVPRFHQLHSDLLEFGYQNIPQHPLKALCNLEHLPERPGSINASTACHFNNFVKWLISIDALSYEGSDDTAI
eukprot:m.133442 g.133442  ORF g.133442 m.133442 type:complete len:678 (-) comp13944_c3_seq1:367-2400(-)